MEKPLNIFISYSWDNESHKEWVIKLANYLIEQGGCDVTLDQYDLSIGGNMTYFMEKGVEEADKVLLILTPNYKLKADNREGGVGMEYSMISQGFYNMQSGNKKFLPILKAGSLETSAPTYVQTTIYHDMSNELLFDKKAYELLRIVHEKPELEKPKRGIVPDFSKEQETTRTNTTSEGFVESAGKILKAKKIAKELDRLYKSTKGVNIVIESAERIFEGIQKKSLLYGIQMNFPIHSEVYNKNNSLRLQAGDYFVIVDYVGYTNNSVRLISIKLSSGIDKHYQPNTSDNIILQFANIYLRTSYKQFFPQFNDNKSVFWEHDDIRFTEGEVVSRVFSLLLEEMSKEEEEN